MSIKDNDDQAFPHYPAAGFHPGMTLRDYFAAKIMPTLIYEMTDIECDDINARANALATEAYLYADAMLAARNE